MPEEPKASESGMNCEDHRQLLASLSDRTKLWFNYLIQSMAVEHDITGPQIDNVPEHQYKERAFQTIHRKALAAIGTGEIQMPVSTVEPCSRLATAELVQVRWIRRAREKGQISAAILQQLPAYASYRAYFDEDPELLTAALTKALADRAETTRVSASAAKGTGAAETKGLPTPRVSPQTERWLTEQIAGCALAGDLWRGAIKEGSEVQYLTNIVTQFRNALLRAISIGEISIEAAALDAVSAHAAREVLRVRELWAAVLAGKLKTRALKKQPLYQKYKEYFDEWLTPSGIADLAINIARDLDRTKKNRGN